MSSSVINCLVFINPAILENFLKNKVNNDRNFCKQVKQKYNGYFFFRLIKEKVEEDGEYQNLLLLVVSEQGELKSISYEILDCTYDLNSTIDIYFYGFHNPEIEYDYYFSSSPDDISCVQRGDNDVTILRGVKKGSLFSNSFYQENQNELSKDYLTFTKKEKTNYVPPYAFSKKKTHRLIILDSIIQTILIKQIQENPPHSPIRVAIVSPLNQLSYLENRSHNLSPEIKNNLVAIKLTVQENLTNINIFYRDNDTVVELDESPISSNTSDMNIDWSILGCDLEIWIFNEGESSDINLLLDELEFSQDRGIDKQINSLKQLQGVIKSQQVLQNSKHYPLGRQQFTLDVDDYSQGQDQGDFQQFSHQQQFSQDQLQSLQDQLQSSQVSIPSESLQQVLKNHFSKSQLRNQLQKVVAFLYIMGKFCNAFFILYNGDEKPTLENYFRVTYEDSLGTYKSHILSEEADFNNCIQNMDDIRRCKKTPINVVGNEIFYKNLKFYTYIIDKTSSFCNNKPEDFFTYLLMRNISRHYQRQKNKFLDDEQDFSDLYFETNLPENMFNKKTASSIPKRKEFKDYLGEFELQRSNQAIPKENRNDLRNDFDYYFISSRLQSRQTFEEIFPSVKKVIILPCAEENTVNLLPTAFSTDFTMDWSFYNDNSCPKDSNMIQELIKIIFCKKIEEEKLECILKSSLTNFAIILSNMQKLNLCEGVMKDILKFSNEYSFQSQDISVFIQFLIDKIVNTNLNVKYKHDKEGYIYINLFILQELIQKIKDETFSKYLENTLTFLFKKSKKSFSRHTITQDPIQPYISEQKTIKLKNLLNKAENISHLFLNIKFTFEEDILSNAETWLQKQIDQIKDYKPEEILPIEPLTKVSRFFPELVNKYILKAVVDIFTTNYDKYIELFSISEKSFQPYIIMEDNLFYKILGVEGTANEDMIREAYEERIRENRIIRTMVTTVSKFLLSEISSIKQNRYESSLDTILQQQQQQQQQSILEKLKKDKLLYKVLGMKKKENEPITRQKYAIRIEKAYKKRIAEINKQSQVFTEIYQFLNVRHNRQLYYQNYIQLQAQKERQQTQENPNSPNTRK